MIDASVLIKGIKKMEFSEYLMLFNIDIQVDSFEEFYNALDSHTTKGEFTSDKGIAISSEYYDYSELEFLDMINNLLIDGDLCSFVKIGNRYFAIPEPYSIVKVKIDRVVEDDGEYRGYTEEHKYFYNRGDILCVYDSRFDYDFTGEYIDGILRDYRNGKYRIIINDEIIKDFSENYMELTR